MFFTLYANYKGEVLDHPNIRMLGRSGQEWVVPREDEMIPLPKGSSLVMIPQHIPVGLNKHERLAYFEIDPVEEGQRVYAVGALLPQGFTRTLLPACVSSHSEGNLPMLGYAAVGLKGDRIYVAAVKSDEHRKWHPVHYNTEGLPAKIEKMLRKYPANRILKQLARCSLEYSCYTAQNIFYQRWEAGIPTFGRCNAKCIGCISESRGGIVSPQSRIDFVPSVAEIVELAANHLIKAKEAIVSFGQGCEGEPSLNARNLSKAIVKIREKTGRGTVNMNSNAGYTEGIKLVCDAGLDSLRVTIFSCNESNYSRYHCPVNYTFDDVRKSVSYAKSKGVVVAVNILTFPGFTDREEEIESLLRFINEYEIDMIQLRNLNIDPEVLMRYFESDALGIGIPHFIEILKKELPRVKIGSYTHPVSKKTTS